MGWAAAIVLAIFCYGGLRSRQLLLSYLATDDTKLTDLQSKLDHATTPLSKPEGEVPKSIAVEPQKARLDPHAKATATFHLAAPAPPRDNLATLIPNRAVFADPEWNLWMEGPASTPSFAPQQLHAGHTYSLWLDIAGISFESIEGQAVYSRAGSRSLSRWLADNIAADSIDIEVMIDPDRRFFEPQSDGETEKPLTIDLRKLRAYFAAQNQIPASPFNTLRINGGDAPFNFGIQHFQVRTKSNSKLGTAPIAVMIWADRKPVDEIIYRACISATTATKCDNTLTESNSLRGVDLSKRGKYPDAAIQLVDRGTDLTAIFRCNICSPDEAGYRVWHISQTADWLAKRITEVAGHLKPPSATDDDLLHAGNALYGLLFFDQRDPDVRAAETSLKNFVAIATSRANEADHDPPSLFVRVLARKPDLPVIPVGLIRVPISGSSAEYLGNECLIETPLELQDYSIYSTEISEWSLLVPPEPADPNNPPVGFDDVLQARSEIKDWISDIAASCNDCIKGLDGFYDWLADDHHASSDVVVIVSQHATNSLFFDASSDVPKSIMVEDVRRTFDPPSLVILDACETAQPGNSEFVRKFNLNGVNSIISTSFAISGQMAGDFLKLFWQTWRKHSANSSYTLSRAVFDTVRDLRTIPADKHYGARALAFVLLGSGSVRIQLPHVK